MFSARVTGIAQLFFTMLSQLVTFHLVFTKRLLRQACLEKGQFKESQIGFVSVKLFTVPKLMKLKQTIRHMITNCRAKKCDLGQKNAGQRCMIFEVARMIELLQLPGTYKFLKIL